MELGFDSRVVLEVVVSVEWDHRLSREPHSLTVDKRNVTGFHPGAETWELYSILWKTKRHPRVTEEPGYCQEELQQCFLKQTDEIHMGGSFHFSGHSSWDIMMASALPPGCMS